MTLREFEHQRRIQIAFSFRGVECRELMPLGPITQAAITHAAGLPGRNGRACDFGANRSAAV